MKDRRISERPAVAILFLLLIAFGTTSLNARAQTGDRVAVMTEMTGEVTLARSGSSAFSGGNAFGTPLYARDRIKTGVNSSASLLYSNGDLLTIGANREVTITSDTSGDANDLVTNVDSDVSASAASLALHRSGNGEIAAMSGLRSGGDDTSIELIAPLNSAVRSFYPTFEWSSEMTFSTYRVRVFSASGVVWEGETDQTSLDYPSSAPKLDASIEYLWQVTGEDMLDEEKSAVAKIRVLSSARVGEIEQAETDLSSLNGTQSTGNYRLLLGSLYAEAGLLDEAVDQFKSLATQYPDSQLPFELLATVYTEMGRTDLAMNALKMASSNQK